MGQMNLGYILEVLFPKLTEEVDGEIGEKEPWMILQYFWSELLNIFVLVRWGRLRKGTGSGSVGLRNSVLAWFIGQWLSIDL